MKYTLHDIQDIMFKGFEYVLPENILKTISELSLQVGSPDYVKTPIFKKRENPMKVESIKEINNTFKKNKRNKAMEIISNEDWESLRTFQTTKIEEKVGIDAQIDLIRSLLNKMTDKNYNDIRNKIIDLIDKLVEENIAPVEDVP